MNDKLLIEITNITKRYEMGDNVVMALQDVNLKIERGEYLSIMGPSGSGKSTFMNILGCLDTPSTGEYKFRGVDVSKLDDDALSAMRNKEIGFVFQNYNLIPHQTVLRNVELALTLSGVSKHERRKRAKEALEKFKMEAASEVGVNLTQGYNGDLPSRQAGYIGGYMVNPMQPAERARPVLRLPPLRFTRTKLSRRCRQSVEYRVKVSVGP